MTAGGGHTFSFHQIPRDGQQVLKQELLLPPELVMDLREEKRSLTCLHFHVHPLAPRPKTEHKPKTSREATVQNLPQDILLISSPADGWSDVCLCSWQTSWGVQVFLALIPSHSSHASPPPSQPYLPHLLTLSLLAWFG